MFEEVVVINLLKSKIKGKVRGSLVLFFIRIILPVKRKGDRTFIINIFWWGANLDISLFPSIHHMLHLMNLIWYGHDFWCTYVKPEYLWVFFSFFENFDF